MMFFFVSMREAAILEPTSVVAGSRLDLAAVANVHACASDPPPKVTDASEAVFGQ
jgi:hypothetical protein